MEEEEAEERKKEEVVVGYGVWGLCVADGALTNVEHVVFHHTACRIGCGASAGRSRGFSVSTGQCKAVVVSSRPANSTQTTPYVSLPSVFSMCACTSLLCAYSRGSLGGCFPDLHSWCLSQLDI